jgi:hypothetical protein
MWLPVQSSGHGHNLFARELLNLFEVYPRYGPQLREDVSMRNSEEQTEAGSAVSNETDEERICRTTEESHTRGMFYPMAKQLERGYYPHAETVGSSKCTDRNTDGDDCTCSKTFPHAPGQTCEIHT